MKYLLLFFSTLPFHLQAEELFTFWLPECLEQATHIFEGKVIGDTGKIKIQKSWRGNTDVEEIYFPALATPHQLDVYAPPGGPQNWNLFVFLTENKNDETIFHPIDYFDNHPEITEAFKLSLSILWLKDGHIYNAFQPTIPGPLVFSNMGKAEGTLEYIVHHNNFKKIIAKVAEEKSCEKKIQLLSNEFLDSPFKKAILDEMMVEGCEEETLSFFKTQLPKEAYLSIHHQLIGQYIKYGKELVAAESDSLFQYEFNFWKKYIQENPDEDWWRTKAKAQDTRFPYFQNLVLSIVKYKVGNWEEKAIEVRDYFANIENYQAQDGYGKLNEHIDQLLSRE